MDKIARLSTLPALLTVSISADAHAESLPSLVHIAEHLLIGAVALSVALIPLLLLHWHRKSRK